MKLAGLGCCFGAMAGFAALLSSCLAREVYAPDLPLGVRSPKITRPEEQRPVSGTDYIIVVDDSISMGDKQEVLKQSLIRAKWYFTRCIDQRTQKWVPTVDGLCPPGMEDHVQLGHGIFSPDAASIITTSVGAGGIACTEKDQGARLIAPATAEELAASDGDDLGPRLAHVGESGCGFEGPLEAMYRFLVDPEPPAHISTSRVDGRQLTVTAGLDTTILEQRAQALRPLSQVVILIVTDEDDCSVRDDGDAWKIGSAPGLARGSSACAEHGNPCCRPCDTVEHTPPSGCRPLAEDEICSKSAVWSSEEDPVNLRCLRSKERFGRDWLFPIERYTQALTAETIVSRSGQNVPNPLFAHGRTPDMVSVVLLSGVPWQDLVTPESLQRADLMQFLTPQELEARGTWTKVLGDRSRGVAPTDPHLLQSVAPRPGLASPADAWDPVHGHEVVPPKSDDLQQSCIFQLPKPRECTGVTNCECQPGSATRSPLCRAPDGTYGSTQRYARALPPQRLLEFARALGPRAHVGSVCPRQLDSMFAPGFGYSDILLQAHALSYGSTYDLSCFAPSLPRTADGELNCKLLELHLAPVDCAALGRRAVSGPFVDTFLDETKIRDTTQTTVCEIPPFPGNGRTPGTAAFACANELHPSLPTAGYCYVDPAIGIGQTAVVDACLPGNQRRIRVIPQNLPLPNTLTELICDYGHR